MIRPFCTVAVALVALPLAACDSPGNGTSITINTNDTDGNGSAVMDGATGQVKIDVPGFEGAFKIPKIRFDASDFQLNGVNLYPGSKISAMNIDPGAKADDGVIKVAFESPATPETVRAWFQERLPKAGFTIATQGTGLTGRTDKDRPFALKLEPQGADKATGTIVIG